MKKLILLAALSFVLIFSVSTEELEGRYNLEPYLIRLAGGRLIHPDKPYAYQYTGIESIHFIRGSFARIFTVDEEFDTFYKIVPGDSDNMTVDFSLRSGVSFRLELVREAADIFRYYYELADPPFEALQPQNGLQEMTPADEKTAAAPGQEPEDTAVRLDDEAESPEAETEEAAGDVIGLYTGIMKKQTEE